MNVLLSVDNILIRFCQSDLMAEFFVPLVCLAFIATVPRLIRTLISWR